MATIIRQLRGSGVVRCVDPNRKQRRAAEKQKPKREKLKSKQKKHDRQIEKYAENASELLALDKIMEVMLEEQCHLVLPEESYEQVYKKYLADLSLSSTDAATFHDMMLIRIPLCDATANSIVEGLLRLYSKHNTVFNVLAYNKESLKNTVKDKTDIKIICSDRNSKSVLSEHNISLKQYIRKQSAAKPRIQVASGTYFSTLCSFGFEVVGRGKFKNFDGVTFLSKNYDDVLSNFVSEYGSEIEEPIKKLYEITKVTHLLRSEPHRPAGIRNKTTQKQIGRSAIGPFIQVLKIIDQKHPIVNKAIGRIGLDAGKNKEIVVSYYNSRNIVKCLCSIGDKSYHHKVSQLGDEKLKMTFEHTSGAQTIKFLAKCREEEVFSFSMPLTININGAWANKDRYCKKSNMYVIKDQLRPKKAKELDTSTNVWLDVGQFFSESK